MASHTAKAKAELEAKTQAAHTTFSLSLFTELALLQKRIDTEQQITDAIDDVLGSYKTSLPVLVTGVANKCSTFWPEEGGSEMVLSVVKELDVVIKACSLPLHLTDHIGATVARLLLPDGDEHAAQEIKAEIQSRIAQDKRNAHTRKERPHVITTRTLSRNTWRHTRRKGNGASASATTVQTCTPLSANTRTQCSTTNETYTM